MSYIVVFFCCCREYLDNIGLVDMGVAELVSVVEEFFGHDGRTAYVFTSDHGMTNWGKTFVCIYIKFYCLGKQTKTYESISLCLYFYACRFPRCRSSFRDTHPFSGVGSWC